ncbi:torsin-1A [Aplysia californica]|uniref:Torsin-1A n=1 Tax=Aplysia californica TaxID=6500 RepID=A0ABM0JYI7_APLCA|nr:torsin-1A [Aplysia californica]
MLKRTFVLGLVLLASTPGIAFSAGISAGFAALGSLAYTSFDALRCKIFVCCNDVWIPSNIEGLSRELAEKLHGQHLVQRTVIGHVKGHMRTSNPPKALVLSFHGLTGVGKNFVSRIIAENIYKGGLRSPFVHLISATKEFPHEGMVEFYKAQLKSWIEGNMTRCGRSMFIFDEVDKLPPLLLDVIKPYMDYYDELGGVNYRRGIFLFLSNSGGSAIAQTVLDHWQSGKKRVSLELSEVEGKVTRAAVNSDSHQGLWHSQLISNHLITAFIPFLPLEKSHVKKCITDALIDRKYFKKRHTIPSEVIDSVLKELTFTPTTEQIFSSTGCKRVSEKVDYVMMDREVVGKESWNMPGGRKDEM